LSFNYTDNYSETIGGFTPPDPNAAAGMSRLVLVVRSKLEVRQKDGNVTFRDSFQNFFSGIPEAAEAGTFFVLPKVIYDEHKGRFVIVVEQRGGTGPSFVYRFWLAVSKNETPDAASDWYKSFIDATVSIDGSSTFANIPFLAVDAESVYITSNLYKISDGSFAGERLWILAKDTNSGFYGGGTLSYTINDPYTNGGSARTTAPATVLGSSSGLDDTVGTFLVSLNTFTDGRIVLQIVTVSYALLANPTFSLQKIPLGSIGQVGLFQKPTLPLSPQLGTAALLDTGDGRAEVWGAVWRNNKLWVVFVFSPRIGVNKGQATVHWIRLGASGAGSITFEAQGDLGGEDIAAGTHTYYPSVAVNSQGVVAYSYGASSRSTYAGAYASVGTSDQSYTVKSGLGPYNRTRDGSNRWGDCSSISVDPVDDSFWVFNLYADIVGSADSNGDGRWGTALGRLACVVCFCFECSL
jgi:hypothetical protein